MTILYLTGRWILTFMGKIGDRRISGNTTDTGKDIVLIWFADILTIPLIFAVRIPVVVFHAVLPHILPFQEDFNTKCPSPLLHSAV